MRTDQPVPVRLQDYRPPAFLVDTVELAFDLQPSATHVRGALTMRRNGGTDEPLRLDGVRLKLVSLTIDGRALRPDAYVQDE